MILQFYNPNKHIMHKLRLSICRIYIRSRMSTYTMLISDVLFMQRSINKDSMEQTLQ